MYGVEMRGRHLACEEDREDAVRLLVSAGADTTLANEVYCTHLSLTAINLYRCQARGL